MRVCLVCGDTLPDEAYFCINCGASLERQGPSGAGVYRCHYHGERFAVAKCGVCGRMICKECIHQYPGRELCKVCYIKEFVPELVLGRVKWMTREGARDTIERIP